VVVEGRVQGVGFRWATAAEARRFGVSGWVRNLPGGGVEAFLQGEPAAVTSVLEWLHTGPIGASVRHIEVAEAVPDPSIGGFEIRG
jgi:acylphosphatase